MFLVKNYKKISKQFCLFLCISKIYIYIVSITIIVIRNLFIYIYVQTQPVTLLLWWLHHPQRLFLNGKNLPVNTIVWFHSFHVFYLTSVFSPFCWIEIGFGWRAQGNEWVRCVKNTEWPTSIMIFFSPFLS